MESLTILEHPAGKYRIPKIGSVYATVGRMHPAIQEAIIHHRPIIGIDEVGRGAWAGPVVAGAVCLDMQTVLPGVRDSKLMTPRARQHSVRHIKQAAVSIGIGWVSSNEVDEHGLSWAVRESGLRALTEAQKLITEIPSPAPNPQPPLIILDGSTNYLSDTSHQSIAIIKADQIILSVSAASVIAKVARDNYMSLVARTYPGYGFERHKGYGVAAHAKALSDYGISAQHRQSYAPVAKLTSIKQ